MSTWIVRNGVFTGGITRVFHRRRTALSFTCAKHGGDNLGAVLRFFARILSLLTIQQNAERSTLSTQNRATSEHAANSGWNNRPANYDKSAPWALSPTAD